METQIVLITLISVGIMLAYAVPGFATIKSKLIKPDAIPAFATILMYVCQPCLTIYSLNNVDYSWDLFKTMLIFFGISFAIQLAFIVVFFLIFKNKYDDINENNVMDIIHDEVGIVFQNVLECSGVYKCTEKGRNDFLKFVDFVNENIIKM